MATAVKIQTRPIAIVRIGAAAPAAVAVGVSPVQIVEQHQNLYTGEYTVTPDITPVVLPTRDKLMAEDVTVHKIPLWEIGNPQGGKTILIGGEKYYGLQ